MESPQIKVLIDEITKLRSEMIELRMEVEGLKADVAAIGNLNKSDLACVVGENSSISSSSLKIIKNKASKSEKYINNEEHKKMNSTTNTKNEELIVDEKILEKNIDSKEISKKEELEDIIEVKIDKKDRNAFRDKLKNTINSEVRYDTWLKTGVNNLSCEGNGNFIFPADNDFTRGILEVRYRDMVENALKDIFKKVSSVKFISL